MPPPPSDADARFDRTVERWFRDRLQLEPALATRLGIHDHDGRLGASDREGVEARAALWRSAAADMERFDPGELAPSRALDRDLLLHASRLSLHELTERRAWAGSCDVSEEIGGALFPLVIRNEPPLLERLERLAERLEAVPTFVAGAQTRLEHPVAEWIDMDREANAAMPGFLATIAAMARAEGAPAALLDRLDRATARAARALEEHDRWLRDVVLPGADGDWRTGPEQLEALLALRALMAGPDEILEIGERLLADERAARDAVCAEIDPTLDPADVLDLVKHDHPATFPEALAAYRRDMDRARRFVIDHDLATLPANDRLVVIETPAYQRHLVPFAAYYDPPRFDREPVGMYVVTPPATPAMMREHNRGAISNTSVHEAYPGHHLQLSAAITNPSLVRVAGADAPELVEGWAFYCERMMKEAGFDDTPDHWFAVHTDAIWRAARIVLDIRLHRGEIGLEEAIAFLAEQTGFEYPAALAEVKRYTRTPGYALSYLYGRHLIERLRVDVERARGAAFDRKAFHDTLIYGGTMPVAFARRLFPELDR
jgi:uncharacterized protein (DUF885 family)